jgi:hypothetical protein
MVEEVFILHGIGAVPAPVNVDSTRLDTPVLAAAYGVVPGLEKLIRVALIIGRKIRKVIICGGALFNAPRVKVVVHHNPRISQPCLRRD